MAFQSQPPIHNSKSVTLQSPNDFPPRLSFAGRAVLLAARRCTSRCRRRGRDSTAGAADPRVPYDGATGSEQAGRTTCRLLGAPALAASQQLQVLVYAACPALLNQGFALNRLALRRLRAGPEPKLRLGWRKGECVGQ